MLGKQNASRQALVLAQVGWCTVSESHATIHLVVDDLGRYRDKFAGVAITADQYFRLHAEREIVGVAFGYLRVNFESRQIDDGHDRCIC